MNYFLTCEHCGHNNEVKSEYLTFCESCAKKLTLNFRDWQKKHKDATLSEYMEKVCVSEVTIEHVTQVAASSKKDSWSHWIGVSKTLSVIIGLGLFILPIYLNITNLNYSLEASTYSTHSLDYTWEEKTYGSFGLHINSPIRLTEAELPISGDAGATIDMLETFVGGSGKEPLMIMLNCVKYKPGLDLNLEGGAMGSINAVKAIPGISNFTYRQESIEITGIPGFEQFGSYDQNGKHLRFVNVGAMKELVFWQILITYDPSIPGMQELVVKTVQSIDIMYLSSI